MGNKLYVRNFSFDTTESGLKEAFAKIGEVTDIKIMGDRDSGRPRGFAFVTMSTKEQAQRCVDQLNGAELDGRELRVSEAQERGRSSSEAGNGPPAAGRRRFH